MKLGIVKALTSISFLSLALLLILPGLVFAQVTNDLDSKLRENQEQIRKLEAELAAVQEEEKTLTSQLRYIDTQINLTELKVQETLFLIAKTNKEIEDLATRIERLSKTVDSIANLLLNRIVSTYKYSYFTSLDLIFASSGFADLLERVKYIQIAQANDKKVLYQLQATKTSFNDQKTEKEAKQIAQERLKKDLENYSKQLDEQKKAKEDLLRITQNNEAKFQQELARLRADTESIRRALQGKGVKLGDVGRGERIAPIGNSGCSTGPHLHFEVMTPARVENGAIIGKENKVDPKTYLDSGQLNKPTANYSGKSCSSGGGCYPGDISTSFGEVYYIFSSSGTKHSGLDIVEYAGTSILAADRGVSYSFADDRACYLTGTIGKGVVVDHQNGIVTLYWHIP